MPNDSPSRVRTNTRFRRIGLVVVAVLSWGVASYAWAMLLIPGFRVPFVRDLMTSTPLLAGFHFGGAGIALLLGPLQFTRRLRARFLPVHRWLGRSYLVACLVGGTAGGLMAIRSSGGQPAHWGFGLLAICWIVATGRAYLSIRAGDRPAHYRWMVRSFSLTLGAVTLRIYLPVSLALGVPFEVAYPIIAWAAWVPNLMVGEWLLRRSPLGATAPLGLPLRERKVAAA